MKNRYKFALIGVILSGCAMPSSEREPRYRAESFEGMWVVTSDTFLGREYDVSQTAGELVFRSVADTACQAADSVVFSGSIVADQMIGTARFCVGSAPLSNSRMVVSILDTSALKATIDNDSGVNFPGFQLERQIRVSSVQSD